MYRTSRDTASWFDKDNKGSLFDKSISKNLGPGKYHDSVMSASTHHRSTDSSASSILANPLSKKTCWNTGSVPFGSGSSRVHFHSHVRQNTLSGPGSYEPDFLKISKP